MNWYYVGGVVSVLAALACLWWFINAVSSLALVTVGQFTCRFIVVAFCLLGYFVLPTGWWRPSPSNVFLNWAAPAAAGAFATYLFVQICRNHKSELQAFQRQNLGMPFLVVLLILCTALFRLAEVLFKLG